MYKRIKQFIKILIPSKQLFRYEPYLRFLYYQLYKGSEYKCVICNKGLRRFIHLDNGDKLCPNCGSLARTRKLWQLVKSEFLKEQISILDFSPSRSIYRLLKGTSHLSYTSSDLSGDFLSDVQYDITAIEASDNTYDLILCYHILEHIEKDLVAMKELHRVLKNGGTCIVQTPFKTGDIYEDYTIKSEVGRLQHFGQKDHVRIYSLDGIASRLKQQGFAVEIRTYKEETNNVYGYQNDESILICTK